MTSIRMPFVSPFPVECLKCQHEMKQEDIVDKSVKRRKKRTLTVECSECGTVHQITQVPLMPDYDIEEVEE